MPARAPQSPLGRRIRVAGSTSNLGPGFDLLGLAVGLHLGVRLEARAGAGAHELERRGPHAPAHPPADGERLLAAFELAAERLGIRGAFQFELEHGIPIGRGFGSSGAATAAGLLLAASLREPEHDPPTREELLAWGIELEGHPDNVTASLFGGCTLCHPDPDGAGPAWYAAPVHPSVRVALAWPETPLATERARAALPRRVPLSDAVENPRRLALLLEGLRRGDPRLLAAGSDERLHVAHRCALIPRARAAMATARDAGAWVATISGAGSGLVALAAEDCVERVALAMAEALGGDGQVVDVVRGAPEVQRDPA